jgi:putative FmdB family regulatory protein
MPVYEYECRKCSGRHEVVQKMTDAPLTTCVSCGGEVYRVISPSGLSFKGEGFYITDYARKGKDGDGKPAKKKEPTPPPTTSGEKKEASTSAPPPSAPTSSTPPKKSEQG